MRLWRGAVVRNPSIEQREDIRAVADLSTAAIGQQETDKGVHCFKVGGISDLALVSDTGQQARTLQDCKVP